MSNIYYFFAENEAEIKMSWGIIFLNNCEFASNYTMIFDL